ncbi:TPA: hypothetical protein N0F65_009766 [Lagenidium giganteum]|uniref:Uncharacterized protein n=1 Tax=Lagenidium giganteum TaxID=4803 RepID=A0AAV2YVQ8_9STRA|nr:TPA: hypothetical protein N0F65_009766 [Lagenidium giganteum]
MRLITPMKDGHLERASPKCRSGLLAMSNSIPSIRQAARPYNPPLRALRLWNLHHLYNLRVRMTGISQIRSEFA